MKTRNYILLISILVLCYFGIKTLIGLPQVLNAVSSGPASASIHTGSLIGAIAGIIIWFGLAFAQWKTGGRWSLGILILCSVFIIAQFFLFYLAYANGRIPDVSSALLRVTLTHYAPLICEIVCCGILYGKRKKDRG